jgi:hypothetical protein
MALWRVEVGGVSHRYVDAATMGEALDIVREDILKGLRLHVSPARDDLAKQYEALGPVKKKHLLASLDGLISPASRREVGNVRSQLRRLENWRAEADEWVRRKVEEAPRLPPPDPLVLDSLVKYVEIDHVERNLERLDKWRVKSPHHET